MFAASLALDLTFLPVPSRPAEGVFFLYAPGAIKSAPQSASIAAVGLGAWLLRLDARTAVLRLSAGKVDTVHGLAMRLPDALAALAAHRGTRTAEPGVPAGAIRSGFPTRRPAPASVRAWSQAVKLALELAGREEMVPTVRHDERRVPRAVWAMALLGEGDRERRDLLAEAMPPSACSALVDPASRPPRPWSPPALLSAFFDAVADSLMRPTVYGRSRASGAARTGMDWESRVIRALLERDNTLPSESHAEAGLAASFAAWSAPLLGAASQRLRLCLRLVTPAEDMTSPPGGLPGGAPPAPAHAQKFGIEYLLQSTADPSATVEAATVWATRGQPLVVGDATYDGTEEHLLRGLAEAARISPSIERSLHVAAPTSAEMSADEAWTFLSEAAPVLAQSGVGLVIPPGLANVTSKRLRARLRVGMPRALAEDLERARAGRGEFVADGAPALGLASLAEYHWEIALGDDRLNEEEFKAIAALQAPLVKWRGEWVAVDRKDLERSREALERAGGSLESGAALAALVTGETELGGETVEVVADGDLHGLAGWLRSEEAGVETPEPEGFQGMLRPYQRRGLSWLGAMERLGLGSCLADDMGLGKTIQVIALLLRQPRLTLLVCPTSVVGNWERELRRFGPRIPVARHHGLHRARTADELLGSLSDEKDGLVVTTYALVRRDEEMLRSIPWQRIVLDEAQAIKNPAARQSKATRGLLRQASERNGRGGGNGHPALETRSASRIALTGTPVENRLAELWSILDFCNPGLLGTLDGFRRRFAIPIERWQDDTVAARLRRLVQPFILRRLKSDPAVASSLPEKNEMSVVCSLSREQATLYQAQVDAAMAEIKGTTGVKRRGRILALITALKQVCDHPSLFLKEEAGVLPARSGKLSRLVEMLEEVLANGQRALVFTQFRQMGDRLVSALRETTGEEVLFLHGGVPALERDELVERFQQPMSGNGAGGESPKIFVLSLKAGGLGLNLTAATNVFHFDRWWNPAVEDQATNRAHRIGQTRNVSVFKLLTAGTLEERIDQMLESKRGLAEKVLGAGERWLTEMSDEDLRELVTLGPEAEVEAEADDGGDGDGDEPPPVERRAEGQAR